MRTSKKTIVAAITAAPLLALGGGLAYASTGGGSQPTPAVTTATAAQTATPAPAASPGQHPATQTCRNGSWYYSGGRWCRGNDHAGDQNHATQNRASQGQATWGSGYQRGSRYQDSGYQGTGQHGSYPWTSQRGDGHGCRDR